MDRDDATTPLCYFNHVRLRQGERFVHCVLGYESLLMPTAGSCDVRVGDAHFAAIGKREHLWAGDPEAVYVPVGATAEITCVSEQLDLLIGGGRFDEVLPAFAVRQEDVDKIQYGSDDTKTHRKIKHILGQKNAGQRDADERELGAERRGLRHMHEPDGRGRHGTRGGRRMRGAGGRLAA